jgi:hypothetical protein
VDALPLAAMFIVVYDPTAADELVAFLTRQACEAWKRTPFIVEVDASADEKNVERLFADWHERRDEVAAELITRDRLENLTRA